MGRSRLTVSKPVLKARPVSVISALKLKCDEPLSNVAFNFNLRRYTAEYLASPPPPEYSPPPLVGRCRLPVSKPELKARLVSALETKM